MEWTESKNLMLFELRCSQIDLRASWQRLSVWSIASGQRASCKIDSSLTQSEVLAALAGRIKVNAERAVSGLPKWAIYIEIVVFYCEFLAAPQYIQN